MMKVIKYMLIGIVLGIVIGLLIVGGFL